MAASNLYPPVSFYFQVTFLKSGSPVGSTSFKEVGGLEFSFKTEEINEGGEEASYSLPSQPGFGKLTLKRGLVVDSAIRTWMLDAVKNFKFTPMDLSIVLLNPKGKPLKTWSATNVWPVKWSISNFNSTENQLAIESMELAYHTFTLS